MIPIEKLREVKQVLYHQSCPDGTAAAMICFAAFRKLLDDHLDALDRMPDFKSVQYHTDFFENKLEPRPGQLFVDITPPRAKWEQWREATPIVLDHHESVKYIVDGLGGTYGENSEGWSGARMAFEHVMKPVLAATVGGVHSGRGPDDEGDVLGPNAEFWDEFSRLAMIRDTWREDHEDFEKATVQAYGLMTLGARDLLAQLKERRFDPSLITMLGEKDLGKAKFMADSARLYEVPCPKLGKTLKVYAYNCTEKKYISDGCHHLLREKADFAISYFVKTEDGKTQVVVSLRTNDPIASTIAKGLGGGGHDKAAGFGLPNGEAISLDTVVAVVANALRTLQ